MDRLPSSSPTIFAGENLLLNFGRGIPSLKEESMKNQFFSMNCYLVCDGFNYSAPQTNHLKKNRKILSSIFLESDEIFDLLVDSSCVDLVWTGG